jgi:Protein of unknown function (DUF2911)
MFRRLLVMSLVPVLFVASQSTIFAQRNPRGTARYEKGGKFVMVEYGRPSLKGRDMFGQLVVGKPWRMGADKSTTLTCSSDLSFGKVAIPAGSYSLWLKKTGDKAFTLVFNKTTGQWGTEHNVVDDFATVPLSSAQGSEKIEQFTINMKEAGKGAELQLLWDTTVMTAAFTMK